MRKLPRHMYQAVRSLKSTLAVVKRTAEIIGQQPRSKSAKKAIEKAISRLRKSYQMCKRAASICLDQNDMKGAAQMVRAANKCAEPLATYTKQQAYLKVMHCLNRAMPA